MTSKNKVSDTACEVIIVLLPLIAACLLAFVFEIYSLGLDKEIGKWGREFGGKTYQVLDSALEQSTWLLAIKA